MITKQWNNLNLKMYKKDYCTKEIEVDGNKWQNSLVSILNILLKEGDTVIDAGAHVGSISLIASRLVKESGTVFSFELQPSIYRDCLLPNIINNNAWNVRPYNCALNNKTELVSYMNETIPYADGYINTGMISVSENKYDNSNDKIGSFTVDDIVNKCPKLIKIDVEGMELKVLQGSEKLIITHKPYIIIELLHQKFGDTPQDCVELLESWGYDVYLITEYYPCNFICIHSSRKTEFEIIYRTYFPMSETIYKPYFLTKNLLSSKYNNLFSQKHFSYIKQCIKF